MKEYIEREAAIKAIENDCSELVYYTKEDAIQCVKAIPAADVVEVVRCRECVYARPLKDVKYDYLCRYWNGHSCNQNQFCSQGKRKEVLIDG